jgi:hypothetical protein
MYRSVFGLDGAVKFVWYPAGEVEAEAETETADVTIAIEVRCGRCRRVLLKLPQKQVGQSGCPTW